MNTAPHQHGLARGSDRVIAGAAVVFVHLVLGLTLLAGLAVRIAPRAEAITTVIDISLPPPPQFRHSR